MRSATVRRLAVRAAARTSLRATNAGSRGLSSTSQHHTASNFVMPALSPTMTEGNIASWKIKEGDSFAPGDVLLEIETDKATMDVEAQDEGVLAKIMQQDGTKAIKVGARIAVLADTDDDLSSLEIPAEEQPTSESKPAESSSDKPSPSTSSSSSQPQSSAPPKPAKKPSTAPPGEGKIQTYPLYPSVQMLLHQKGLSTEDANKIPASGPSGRLLKGDVLAYLGEIESNYAAEQSKRITDLGHLDLSNIKLAAPKKAAAEDKKSEARQEAVPEPDLEVAVPISLTAVYEAQERLQEALGMSLPLSTFIARASEIANEKLPRAKGPASADELFDSVLGLKTPKKTSRGSYTPHVTALGPVAPAARLTKAMDIIDVLAGSSKAAPRPVRSGAIGVGSWDGENIFSLSVKKGEERRARVYLERVKTVLESEPGRCVL